MGCIRLIAGIFGNATSLLLYAAPILTFRRVIKKRSTEEFSCVPYVVALLNCLLYTWYGLPVVSVRWENFPVVTINGLGILLESSFIIIYLLLAAPQTKRMIILMVAAVLLIFCATVCISSFKFSSHHHRKMFVGSVGLVASVCMYGSPLIAMKRVIQTRSVEFMPFYLSLFSFLASSLWMAYGLLGRDLFLMVSCCRGALFMIAIFYALGGEAFKAPNLVGSPLGLMQLILYCMYKKNDGKAVQGSKLDTEKGAQLQALNGKGGCNDGDMKYRCQSGVLDK